MVPSGLNTFVTAFLNSSQPSSSRSWTKIYSLGQRLYRVLTRSTAATLTYCGSATGDDLQSLMPPVPTSS